MEANGRTSRGWRPHGIGAVVALAATFVCAWPAPTRAQSAPPTLRVTQAGERLKRVSPEVRQAVRIIDSDQGTAGADALWRMYCAVARRGNAALLEWAFELQSVVRSSKGNYLHALCWVLNEHHPARARALAVELAKRGVAIGPNTGHYVILDHLDPDEPIPGLPTRVGKTPLAYYVDAVAAVQYDLSYRPDKKGQLSRLLQVTYEDGTRLDIDIRLISDSYDPASNQSVGRMFLGLGGRLYPLRMDRLSTPRLWEAKHAALAEMHRYNKGFVDLVSISTSGVMVPLGLAVPVQQPASGAVKTTRPMRSTSVPRPAPAAQPRGKTSAQRKQVSGSRSVAEGQGPKLPRPLGAAANITTRSRIGESSFAIRQARSMSEVAQRDVDNLLSAFRAGNPNPGIGTRRLGGGVYELRGRNAGRVIVREVSSGHYDIVGKFQGHVRGDKANSAIIRRLIRDYNAR